MKNKNDYIREIKKINTSKKVWRSQRKSNRRIKIFTR